MKSFGRYPVPGWAGAEPWAARAGPALVALALGRYRRPDPPLVRLREICLMAIYVLSYVVV
jgi:hypothetical protein